MSHAIDQYPTIAAGSGWVDRSDRGRLRFDGRDAASFLHALVTADVQSLAAGKSVYAAYLTPLGRMISDLTIHHAGEYLLVDVPVTLAATLAIRFDQLIFSEDVRVTDVTSSTFHVTVVGRAANAALPDPFPAELLQSREDGLGLPAIDVLGPMAARDGLIAGFAHAGSIPLTPEFFEALRIDAGRPAFGVDMTEETIPLEAGLLDRAISTTKGCYVGQEIIIRILHRGGGRVAKRLVRIEFDPSESAVPSSGSSILIDGKDAGRVTSAALSPATGRLVALGYVHRDVAEAGREVRVLIDGGQLSGTIAGFAA
jgi:folate-binding protein YgfZ